jgi:hypothetical protein
MVRRQMGLLDDAIRDHLELKRRRGADPGEVAREQSEALREAGAGTRRAVNIEDGYAPFPEVSPEAIAAARPRSALAGKDGRLQDRVRPAKAGSSVDEETAEFDMAIVLNESPETPDGEFPPPRRIVVGPAPGSSDLPDERLAWDFPDAASPAQEAEHEAPVAPDELRRDADRLL